MKLLIILSCFVSFASAGSYTSALNLYKPAFGDTNYVTPFSTGMDTLDSAIPDKRTTKTAVFDSSVTINTPFTVKSSVTITGSVGMSATGASVTTISSANITSAVIPTITGNTSFGTATATTTFSGWIDIGMVRVSSIPAGTTTSATATCPTGYHIFGGPDTAYCNNGGTAIKYFNTDAAGTRFTVYCNAATNNVVSGWCGRAK